MAVIFSICEQNFKLWLTFFPEKIFYKIFSNTQVQNILIKCVKIVIGKENKMKSTFMYFTLCGIEKNNDKLNLTQFSVKNLLKHKHHIFHI